MVNLPAPGHRVVVRYRLPSGQATDALGELLSADADTVVVDRWAFAVATGRAFLSSRYLRELRDDDVVVRVDRDAVRRGEPGGGGCPQG